MYLLIWTWIMWRRMICSLDSKMINNCRQKACVAWVIFRFKQGVDLSPIFFTIYIDKLLVMLRNTGIGCHIGVHITVHSLMLMISHYYVPIYGDWMKWLYYVVNMQKNMIWRLIPRKHYVLNLEAKLILMNICQLMDVLCNGQRVWDTVL